MMVEKRGRKMQAAINDIAPPKLVGPENAAVTLVGWGSTEGVIREAVEKLAGEEGIVANHLQIKWIVPFHAAEISRILSQSKHVILVENSYSGQFARYLRSETGFDPTATSASTTANRSCPITLSKPSKISWLGKQNSQSRSTKCSHDLCPPISD